MTYNEEGLPFVDLRDCTTPREVVRRVEEFLDEINAETLRAYAATVVLTSANCVDIARQIATKRLALTRNKIERLASVVQILEDLRAEVEPDDERDTQVH